MSRNASCPLLISAIPAITWVGNGRFWCLYPVITFLARFRSSETRNTRPPQHSMCVAASVAPGDRGSGEGLLDYFCQIFAISAAPSAFHAPCASSRSSYFPIRTRINLSVGNPTAAVIRLTCRFFPSMSCNSSQLVGIACLKRTGGSRGNTVGPATNKHASHGRVL